MWWRLSQRFQDFVWWFRHRFDPRHQYNIVRTGLPPGYYDPDMRLIAAIFEETSLFVERTAGVIAWDGDEGHGAAWAAFTAAAEWWKAHRDTLFDDPYAADAEWDEAKRLIGGVVEHLRRMWYP